MKKHLLVFTITTWSLLAMAQNKISLLHSDANGVTLKVNFSDYQFKSVATDNGEAKTMEAPNTFPLLQKGRPEGLKMVASIALPNSGSLKTTILSEQHLDLPNMRIAPSKGNLYRNTDPDSIGYEFGADYQKNEFFPNQLVVANTPYVSRSLRGCAIDINLFQYNPVLQIVRIFTELIVRIDFIGGAGKNELTEIKPIDAEFERIYQRQYLNYQSAKTTPLSEKGEMLILCHDAFMSAMEPFITHKRSMGIPTSMALISSVGNTVAQIADYVKEYYRVHNLKYLLLVGDYDQVTTTLLNTSGGKGGSDNTYSYLAGDDHYPEILVGRFSAETIEQVNTMAQRTIQYERDPVAGNWPAAGLGIASSEGPGDQDEYDFEHIRNIRSLLMTSPYTTVIEEYDGNQGGIDGAGDASAARVAAAINQGLGIINYCGHGDWNMFVSSSFTNAKVNGLRNIGKWPFIFSVACLNGDFTTQTCFAEHWLRASYNGAPTGALAAIMSTINQPWIPPMKGQDEMVKLVTETEKSNLKHTFGGITINALMAMTDAYSVDGPEVVDTWTLFGDPSVMIRTAESTPLTVEHPLEVETDATSITVTSVTEGASVAVMLRDSLLAVGIISGGTATIPLPPLTIVDTLRLTASAFNRTPYRGSIGVKNPPKAGFDEVVYIATPNPTNEMISLTINGLNNENIIVYLLDISGKVIEHKEMLIPNSDSQIIQFSSSDLAAGVYHLNVVSSQNQKTVKVVVIR